VACSSRGPRESPRLGNSAHRECSSACQDRAHLHPAPYCERVCVCVCVLVSASAHKCMHVCNKLHLRNRTHFAVVPMGPLFPGSCTWEDTLRTSSHTWSICRVSNLSRRKVLCLLSFFLRLLPVFLCVCVVCVCVWCVCVQCAWCVCVCVCYSCTRLCFSVALQHAFMSACSLWLLIVKVLFNLRATCVFSCVRWLTHILYLALSLFITE